MTAARADGSALLTVVAATAALAVPVLLLLLQAAASYHAGVFRAERAQAQELARAAWLQLSDALATGELGIPGQRAELRILNGVVQPAGATVTVGRFDPWNGLEATSPIGSWPPVTSSPAGRDDPLGVGVEVTLRRVLGPRGEARGRSLTPGSGALLEGEAVVWFRHAVVVSQARLLVGPDGVQWLD